MHRLTNYSYHEAAIIHLVFVGSGSSTSPLHSLFIHNTSQWSSTSCQLCIHDMGLRLSTHFRGYTLIIRPWGWRSPSLLGPTPLISFIRPQGRDHPPCWLCISVYGAEIIRSMHRMTNHSMPHLYLLTFIISLGAETIHPYVSFIISLKPQAHGHPPCWLCFSFYVTKIIYPMHQQTSHLYHKDVIILLVSVGPWSSTHDVSCVSKI